MSESIGKYLQVEYRPPLKGRKTGSWLVRNGDNILGNISWYGPWRQYCFFPMEETVFSGGCLDDISAFLKKCNEERKRERKAEADNGSK